MGEDIRILIVEDSLTDTELAEREIRKSLEACVFRQVETREDFLAALDEFQPDLILSDYHMAGFDGMTALKLSQERVPLIPVIIWTGSLNEDTAVGCMKAGAANYVIKENVKRLGPAIIHALEERQIQLERREAEAALRRSEERYRRTLNNMLEGCQIIDYDWRYIYVNDAAARHGRRQPQELLMHTMPEMYPGIEKTELFAVLQRCMTERTPYRLENEFHFPEGDVGWFELSIEPVPEGLFVLSVDISERKQAEEALRQKERHFQALIENAADGVALISEQGRFKYVSPSARRIFGYGLDENIDIDPATLTHPDDLSMVLTSLANLIENPSAVRTLQYRFRHANGSWRWIESTISNMLSEPGVRAIVINFRDVTWRKQSENALMASEARFSTIFQASPLSIAITRLGDNHLMDVNTAWQSLTGFTREEAMAHTVLELNIWVNPAERVKLIQRLRKQGTVRGFEYQLRKKSGEIVEALHSAVLIDLAGEQHMLSMSLDITERRRSEEAIRQAEAKYHNIFENSLGGIFQSTLAGRIITANPALARIWGYDSPDDLIDNVNDLAHQIYADPEQRAQFMRLMEEQGKVSAFEYQVKRKDGSLVWVSENAHAVMDTDNTLLYYEGTVKDISDSKKAELRIQQQLERLTTLSEIDRIIASSFDLNLTLNLLVGHVARQLRLDAAAILLFDQDANILEYAAGQGFQAQNIKRLRMRIGEDYAGKVALERRRIHVPNLKKVDSPSGLAPLTANENFVAYFGLPLIAKGQVKGVLEVFQRVPLHPDEEWLAYLNALAEQAAIAIDNAQLFENLQQTNAELSLAYDATIEGWSHALDLRDKETEGHTQRVTEMTIKLGRSFGLNDNELLSTRWGALLHDIGKMGIPDSILLKPDKLSAGEWETMKMHPVFALEMLERIHYLKSAIDIPYCHHEKWDGSGYPRGLKGEQIPIVARIFAVVDVWDALTSDRPYRPAWSRSDALEYIKSAAGTHFDPRVVKLFLESEHIWKDPGR